MGVVNLKIRLRSSSGTDEIGLCRPWIVGRPPARALRPWGTRPPLWIEDPTESGIAFWPRIGSIYRSPWPKRTR